MPLNISAFAGHRGPWSEPGDAIAFFSRGRLPLQVTVVSCPSRSKKKRRHARFGKCKREQSLRRSVMLFRCARSLARSRALPLAGAGLACIGVGAGSSFVSSAVCEPQSTPVPEGSKLLGKVALVAGSSEGIGAGIALAMAQAGADVCINFIGDPTPAEALADDIRKLGRRVVHARLLRRLWAHARHWRPLGHCV